MKYEVPKGYASGAEPMARNMSYLPPDQFLETQIKTNENLYTFTLNCVSKYKGEDYGDGQSYIYGPVSGHEKEWLRKEGIESKKNVCHILSLNSKDAQYIYGKFLFPENLSRYGRSDMYTNNPRDIIVENL